MMRQGNREVSGDSRLRRAIALEKETAYGLFLRRKPACKVFLSLRT